MKHLLKFNKVVGPPVLRGSGLFLHTDSEDRPQETFDGTTTIRTGRGEDASYLLLPLIPERAKAVGTEGAASG